MSSVQKGVFGVKWAISAGVTGTGIGTVEPQSVEYSRKSDKKTVKGADGYTKCVIYSDQMEGMTLEVVPSGASQTLAKAANILPAIGADVTLTDVSDAQKPTGPGGATLWTFEDGTKRETVDGEARLTFVLVRHFDPFTTIA
jgi:hypothetical protein